MDSTVLHAFRDRWIIPASAVQTEADALSHFARCVNCPPLIAAILQKRGIGDPTLAAAFLRPQLKSLFDPDLLPGMDTAAARIVQAVIRGEPITIYGDYDVDGIAGTAMLWHLLKAAGANVTYYIPHRVTEGYGLQTEAVGLLINAGTQLFVTVDCGISGHEPAALARDRGIDMIVTDHHATGPTLPKAAVIVHPRLEGSRYPNPDLCGAGVAFKLAWAIARKISGAARVSQLYRDLLVEFCALVGLATIADVMPLTGENRVLASLGLRQLPRTTFPGLRALIDAAGYGDRAIDDIAAGFALAPRLNAAGRMGHAKLAVEMLTTATAKRAAEIAIYLEGQNRQRQATEKRMVALACEQLNAQETLPPVLVVVNEHFHTGVVGIVASRLAETYARPTFVLGVRDGVAAGSGRSIPGFALHEAIEHCRDLLISGGGHAAAGGIKLSAANVDALCERLSGYGAGRIAEPGVKAPRVLDGTVTLAQADVNLARHLAAMEPFGEGNRRPRLLARGVRVSAPPRRVGGTGTHLQLTLSQDGTVRRAIAFRLGMLESELPSGSDLDLVIEVKLSEFNCQTNVDLQVVDVARTDGSRIDPPSAAAERPVVESATG